MQAHILVAEGNPENANEQVMQFGCKPYGPAYADVLRRLDPELTCTVVRPCEEGPDCLPSQLTLQDFHGVVWSGSALNIYDDCPEIAHQKQLAERVLEAGLPVFGSCWGLQLFATVLGGRVHKNPRGRELGPVEIEVSDAGLTHPMLAGRPRHFAALAAHRDEVAELPPGAVLLAGNSTSPVQAIAVERDGVRFWGAQYHPEIDYITVGAIMQRTHDALLREGFFASEEEYRTALQWMQKLDNPENQPPEGILSAPELRSVEARAVELTNWLETMVAQG
jgi:GMP synthase (glutamine-hydrolysing)